MLTKGQDCAVRAQFLAMQALVAAFEDIGAGNLANVIAAHLRRFHSPDTEMMETVEATARAFENNPFRPAGMPTVMTVIEGGLSTPKEEER